MDIMVNEKTERVKWIDVARCLGIFAIYLGHCGSVAGNAYTFVFYYHVPLFFFLSGCMEYYAQESDMLSYSIKKIKTIMIPFWQFCFLSIVLYVMLNNIGLGDIKQLLIIVGKGNIRNVFFAPGLWFLTCLFVMEIIFKIIKGLKYKWIMFIVCVVSVIVSTKILQPTQTPQWPYNLDSALYYIIYFMIGYITYPYILKLFRLDTIVKKIIFVITGMLSFVYSALLFVGGGRYSCSNTRIKCCYSDNKSIVNFMAEFSGCKIHRKHRIVF